MESTSKDNASSRRPRFVLRPPDAVVDTWVLQRAIEARNPAWHEAERYIAPLPSQAVAALELAAEFLR
jgi:hypothetical protein